MNDQEHRRLRRLVLRCFFFSLALIIILAFCGSYELRQFNEELALKKTTIVKQQTIVEESKPLASLSPVNGTNGKNGSPGINGQSGVDGTNGADGQNVTPDEIAQAVSSYLQANPPEQGIQGPAGVSGRTVLLRLDPLSNLEECQYLGDLIWQPISECE